MVLNGSNSVYVASDRFLAFRLRSPRIWDLRRATAAARHAGHHGLISCSIWRHLGGVWQVSSFLMVSVLLSARATLSPRAEQRLRSRRIRKLMRPWWPARRAAAVARLRSQIRPLLDQKPKSETLGPSTKTRVASEVLGLENG